MKIEFKAWYIDHNGEKKIYFIDQLFKEKIQKTLNMKPESTAKQMKMTLKGYHPVTCRYCKTKVVEWTRSPNIKVSLNYICNECHGKITRNR